MLKGRNRVKSIHITLIQHTHTQIYFHILKYGNLNTQSVRNNSTAQECNDIDKIALTENEKAF